MEPVSQIVRRSTLIVPVLDREAVRSCWRYNADAVVLDLGGTVPQGQKAKARSLVAGDIDTAARGGAEVFVRINRTMAYADIKASSLPGLTGIMLPDAESAADIEKIDGYLSAHEREAGIPADELQIILSLTTVRGVWNIREMLRASTRVTAAALEESALCRDMGIVPTHDFDPFRFARGRLVIELLGHTRLPLGMPHPLSVLPRDLDEDEVTRIATVGANTGLKGGICLVPSWVGACNRAFTPTEAQIDHYREVRRLFAQGIARGTAAVSGGGGRMIDVPVDERARKVIDLWERCRERDAQKAAALDAAMAQP